MFTESAEIYDAIYQFKDYQTEAGRVAALIRQANPQARSILDVACGTGEHARWLASNHGFEVTGLDLDDALLAVARRKVPQGQFICADMEAFDLGQQYDAVICLFSSIAYLVTLDRVSRAFERFRHHLQPEGIVLVEPWFEPGIIDPARLSRRSVELEWGRVERLSQIAVDGRISRIHFQYKIETTAGRREVSEVHELGLFTVAEMQAALATAGFSATFDPSGLAGRGLWTAGLAA
jgi:ubiquinone/menaquinone biosynthesis C-methylase UbiE